MKDDIVIDYAQIKIYTLVTMLALLAISVAAWLAPVSAAPLRSPPPMPEGRLQISAWMPTSWDGDSARASFSAHTSTLSAISPYWYGVSSTANLSPFIGSRDSGVIDEAQNAGILIIPTISNSFNGARIHNILADQALADKHRQNILNEVMYYDYDGIDLDYENLAAEDKQLFSDWVTALARDLHANGKLLTITVQPKTFDADGWDGPGAQDYRALAGAADELRLMAYGWCWATGCVGSAPPGPIAPIHWMQRVIDYAKTQAPAEKLVLGVHLYGYDWSEASEQYAVSSKQWPGASVEDMNGQALVWEQANALLQEHNAILQWWQSDDRGLVQEPWFSYADGGHYVTFANADSVAARAQLAADEALRGIIFWRLGGEDPTLWERLPQRSYNTYLPMQTARQQ